MKSSVTELFSVLISFFFFSRNTVKNLSIKTDRSAETVQAQIRLLLKEQSDLGLHCLPFQHNYGNYHMIMNPSKGPLL